MLCYVTLCYIISYLRVRQIVRLALSRLLRLHIAQ